MASTKIEWTESTWNPVTGCTKISSGCKNCYAARMSARLQAMGHANYQHGFCKVVCHEQLLGLPLTWKKPQSIFVNSMSDLFHEKVPDDFIYEVFSVMRMAQQHRFQILTKRSERLASLAPRLRWTGNIWQGVTVEDADCIFRIDDLRGIGSAVKFLSMEPLLSAVPDMNLRGIDWVIVGGESGPGARPMSEEWVDDILAQCRRAKVPFFFKQWGGVNKKANGRELQGRIYSEMPAVT